MIFRLYFINMLNFQYYDRDFNQFQFEYNMSIIRDEMRRGLISGWRIVRASDGIAIAQSKGLQS